MARKNSMNTQKLVSIKEFVKDSIKVLKNCNSKMEELREKLTEHLRKTNELLSGETKLERYIIEIFTNLFLEEKDIEEALKDFYHIHGIIEIRLNM